ncbi:MAG TPA: hypothetical protein VJM12_13880 [Pyrinomonadaceae bacterium]|nr:hypothetical protein [Pyrinomonadaceae bacterium]
MDLIHPGAKTFSGHGWILDYDVDWISVRAGWALEELTFQNFGFREGVINNDDLLKAVISQRTVRLTDPSRTPDMKKQIRAEAVSKAKAWWQKAEQSWNRFDALLEALRSDDAVRQHWTLDWLIHGKTKCDGLTRESFKKFIAPEVKRLLNSSNERVRGQAKYLLNDNGASGLEYKN